MGTLLCGLDGFAREMDKLLVRFVWRVYNGCFGSPNVNVGESVLFLVNYFPHMHHESQNRFKLYIPCQT